MRARTRTRASPSAMRLPPRRSHTSRSISRTFSLGSRSDAIPRWRTGHWRSCVALAPTATNWRCVAWWPSSPPVAEPDRRPQRLAALIAALDATHLDALLLTSLANIRYLTGFSGSSALVVVTPREVVLITDFRYATQVVDEVGGVARVAIESQSL